MIFKTIVAAALVASAAGGAAAQFAPRPVDRPIWTSQGLLTVLTSDSLDGARIDAVVPDEPARFVGAAPGAESFVVTSDVMLTAPDGATVAAALAESGFGGAAVSALSGLPGHFVVDVATVGEAIDVATALRADGRVGDAVVLTERAMPDRGADPGDMLDPLLPDQWHFENLIDPLFDCDAPGAWSFGATGAGVLVGVVESANFLTTHEDLAANYDASPSTISGPVGSHPTQVAGIIGAVGFNNLGVRGLAHEASLSTVLIGGTEATRAAALAHLNNLHDVKNNSWGPTDNGRVFHLSTAEKQSIELASVLGRDGKGTVLVWAAGNGSVSDRIDYDGFASSRHTIATGWIGDDDEASYFNNNYGNETGSAMMTVAQSATLGGRGITSTHSSSVNPYRSDFGGSSAAAPLLSGLVALMLDANPSLTWRDVQHIVVESARKNDPSHPDWTLNGAGRSINYSYGFGAVDAASAMQMATTWTNVPDASTAFASEAVGMVIPDGDPGGVIRTLTIDEELLIEHVEVTLNIDHAYRGDLEIMLTGPSGTESLFALGRNDPGDDYVGYTFMSVRHWGEASRGDWSLQIVDVTTPDPGVWTDWSIRIHGVPVPPCPGDVNGDDAVDFEDLNLLLDAWGDIVTPGAGADLDGGGTVDFNDLNILLEQWGEGCL